jgi:hypothetical protein
MITQFAPRSKWLTRLVEQVTEKAIRLESSLIPLERPSLSQLARPGAALPRFVAESRLARKYLDLLGPLDWDRFPQRDPHRAWPRACTPRTLRRRLLQSGINSTPVVTRSVRSERRLRATKHLSLPRATDFVHFKRDALRSLRSE